MSSPAPISLIAFLEQAAEREQAKKREDVVGNELLRRAALLRVLDEDLYRGPLVSDLTAAVPSFSAFTSRPELEALSIQSGTFAVRDFVRPGLIEQWNSDPEALRRFSNSLVLYFHGGSPLDIFTHQIFADPPAALDQFHSLYKAADDRFDLAQCDTLLRILRNRGILRGPQLTAALNDREPYFRSRSLFADEWLRTSHFLERPKIAASFQQFLTGTGKWLLRFFAAGGGGKTAYLRWLIARYCVPEHGPNRARIPVARIDLDFVHLPALAAHPWLLLIPVAEQLSRQTLLPSFESFLGQWRRYAPLLLRPVSRETLVSLPSFDPGRAEEVVSDFTIGLNTDSVLVVIDTFEEILIHYSGAVAGLLKSLAIVNQSCPGFNVVISGRQDVFTWREPLTSEPAVPPNDSPEAASMVLEIKPWDRKECWDYLTRVRELTPAMQFEDFPELGGGNPLKLSLFADLVGRGNPFTGVEVGDLRRVEVEYLILRVIERIPESQCTLRWLLRYAVIPRQLTQGFVEAVIAPHLSRAINATDPISVDAPNNQLPDGADIVRRRRPWENCSKPFQTEQEWPALLRYAGSATWITLEGGQPRLQPEVVSPMRYLLQAQPVVADIHSSARAYFQSLAQSPGHDWAEMISEAVYHSFQFNGAAAESYWEEQLKKPEALEPKARRQLAELLLSADFLDENHEPLPHATGKLIEHRTIARATLELAALDTREAIVSNQSHMLESASARLQKVEIIEQRNDFHLVDDGWRAFVEASVVGRSDHPRALQIIAEALAAPHAGLYESAFCFLQGSLLQQDGRFHDAMAAFQKAAFAAATGKSSLIPVWQIQTRLAALAFECDNLAEATRQYEFALHPENLESISDTDLTGLIETLIRIYRSSANWNGASSRLRHLQSLLGQRIPSLFTSLTCELALDTCQPELALAAQDTTDARITGMALAQLGDFNNASRHLEEYWKGNLLSSTGAATQARFDQIQLILRGFRNHRRARTMLSSLKDLGEFAFLREMLTMELDVRTGDAESAKRRWQAFRVDLSVANPRKRARCLATALALEIEPRKEFGHLVELLAQVEPSGARIPLLQPFQIYSPANDVLTAGVSSRFRKVLPAPSPDDPDFALKCLLLIDVLRYIGDRDSAASMVKAALTATSRGSMYLRRQLVCAMFRMGGILDNDTLLDYQNDVHALQALQPEFAAMAGVEIAEEWLKRGDFGRAATLLNRPPQPGNQYAVRFQIASGKLMEHADSAAAEELFARANHMAAELGIPERYAGGTTTPTTDPFPAEHQVEIFTLGPLLMEVDLRPAGRPIVTVTFDLHRVPLIDSIQRSDWKSALQDLISSAELGSKLGKFLPITEGLEEWAASNPVEQPHGEPVDLRIAFSESDLLAALPWELASLDTLQFVYRGVRGVDSNLVRWQSYLRWLSTFGGSAGASSFPTLDSVRSIESWLRNLGHLAGTWNSPNTRRSLAATRPTRVALIKLEQEFERSSRLSYGQQGISVEEQYRRRGIDFISFDPRYLSPYDFAKIHSAFDVIHFCLPLSELSGTIQMEFLASELTGYGPALLNQPNLPGRWPIVILDVPMPPRDEFWAQQLAWRNLFGRQMFEQSTVEAVICAGLARDPDAYLSNLIDQLASHASVGALVKALNRESQMAAALYATDPALPC